MAGNRRKVVGAQHGDLESILTDVGFSPGHGIPDVANTFVKIDTKALRRLSVDEVP